MITKQDEAAIVELARQYRARRVMLFGSAAEPTREGRDIDLAVEGVAPADFFRFYGDLIFSVSKPVDLVDLSEDTPFTRKVNESGVCLYGQLA